MHRLLFLLVLASMISGCGMVHGTMSYRDNPDLVNIKLYTKHQRHQGEELGVVQVSYKGYGDCGKVAAEGMALLLEEARALGGEQVVRVRFHHRHRWAGRIVCRNFFGRKRVDMRGMAVK